MKALWLAGWYPNKLNTTNGDFIQRHAQAVSLYCDVHVIHVEKDATNKLNTAVEIVEQQQSNLIETIVLYKPPKFLRHNKLYSFFIYQKLYKQQVKKYIQQNGLPDVVHVQIAMKAGIIALWLKKKFNIPYVITDQWTMYNSTAPDAYEKRSAGFKRLTKKIFFNSSLFISVSKNLVDVVAKKITTVSFAIAYNVVNTNIFFYRDVAPQQPFTFIHSSTLKEQKNPTTIIDAFIVFNEQYPQSKLLMVGDAPETLKQYFLQKNLPENIIELAGFIPYEKLGAVTQQCHAFVLFSTRENMPCVVLEALCCGLPVITSNAGGTAEVINDTNGIVVYDYTIDALANAMEKLYNNYHKYNHQQIAKDAAAKFSYAVIGKQIFDAYKSVLR